VDENWVQLEVDESSEGNAGGAGIQQTNTVSEADIASLCQESLKLSGPVSI